MEIKKIVLVGISAACVAALFLIGPIPQDLGYHDFADKRQFFGIVNFNDVLSNAPFLLFGIYGFINIQRKKILRHVKPQYIIFCAGVLFTGFGSAYYHLNPDNNTLVWDRLPMTVAFMSIFSVVIVEYLNHDVGRKMFIPLLLLGIASVVYWHISEGMGRGDLRPYAIVQFLPMILIPLILVMYEPATTRKRYIIWGLVFYGLSKVFEALDVVVYEVSGDLISGHSVKHVLAALGSFSIMRMFIAVQGASLTTNKNKTLQA